MSSDRLAEMAAEMARMGLRVVEQGAEIDRLRDMNEQLRGLMLQSNQIMQTERDALYARVTELEAIVTVGHGAMGTLAPDEPSRFTFDVLPSAPPHRGDGSTEV